MTYQIIITEETAANIIIDNNTTNVSITTNDYPITIEYNAVIEQAGGNTTYGDSNVRTFLASGTNTGNIISTANVSGAFILGNGSQLTGLPATYGNANVAANLAAFGSNPISTSGNITAGYFLGNGSQLTGLPVQPGTYGNANVAANLAAFANNPVSTTGNITAGNIRTAGQVTAAGNIIGAGIYTGGDLSAQGNVIGVSIVGSVVSVSGNVTGGNLLTAGQVSAGGNVIGANISTPNGVFALGVVSATGNVTGGNIRTAGQVSATGNVTGNFFVGNGSLLTGIVSSYGNANVAANLAAFATNPISTSGNITAGYVVANGSLLTNITGANVTGVVANATFATSAGTATTANTVTNNAQANITSVGTLTSLSVSGNVDAGNLRTAGLITATGNVSGGNVFVPINGRYYGDFTSGTASGRTAFQTTATGTSSATSLTAIPGANHVVSNTAFSSQINLFANGADVGNSAFGRMQMFGNRLNFEATAAGTGTVGNMRFTAGSAQMVFLNTGNVGIGNANPNHTFSTNDAYFQGTVSVTANVITGNVNTTGQVSATGNITTGSFFKTQSYTAAGLTAITGSIGQIAAVSDSAGGAHPNGMIAFWDTSNARWSYIHDNSAV